MSKTTTIRTRKLDTTTISVDQENAADEWWDAVMARRTMAPEAVRPLLAVSGPDSVLVTAEEAEQIREWASNFPGWDDPEAPEYAPHPLVFGS